MNGILLFYHHSSPRHGCSISLAHFWRYNPRATYGGGSQALVPFQVGTMAPVSILHLLSLVMGRGQHLSPPKVSFCPVFMDSQILTVAIDGGKLYNTTYDDPLSPVVLPMVSIAPIPSSHTGSWAWASGKKKCIRSLHLVYIAPIVLTIYPVG